jgi:20S proteasome alpha/beta subunit
MTIAIGARCHEGVIICADTKVTAGDGITTQASKLRIWQGANASGMAVANSAEDARAADMLADEMSHVLMHTGEAPQQAQHIEHLIKETMTNWHKAYTQFAPPPLEFLLAIGSNGKSQLYMCAPPNTVLRCRAATAIGVGSIVVDPLLNDVFCAQSNARQTLMKIAYLMNRAKTDLAAKCGGDSDAILVTDAGLILGIGRPDMADAESIMPHIDIMLDELRQSLLSQPNKEEQTKFLKRFSEFFRTQCGPIAEIDFSVLRNYQESINKPRLQSGPDS